MYNKEPTIWLNDKHEVKFVIDEIYVFEKNEKFSLSGGETKNYMGCSDNEWHCISSKLINFSYKKNWSESPQRWSFEGLNFYKLGTVVIPSSHELIDVDVILTSEDDNKSTANIIYFSKEYGVVKFIFKDFRNQNA